MIWLISDTHFYHTNIITYCSRPFDNAEQMNEAMVANWNKAIGPFDTVYHLGDFILSRKDLLYEMVNRLHGDIILIRGNHDRDITTTRFLSAGIKSVHSGPVMLKDQGIILSHAPIESTSGLFNIHGHTHNSDPMVSYPFYSTQTHRCISVEMTNYAPISLDRIKKEM